MENPQSSEIEKKLNEDWKDIPHLMEINVHGQFFDLGADSLAATTCISRIRSAFRAEFLLNTFFLDEAPNSDSAREIQCFNNGD